MMKFFAHSMIKSFAVAALAGFCTIAEAQTFTWSPAGPILTAGRARNMIVDKTDPNGNTLYVGSTSSGVFKSTDAGANWAPLDDQGTVRNISYMAQRADGQIYAATGEGFLRASQKLKALPGTGLYILNGGTLQAHSPASKTGSVIVKIACHPTNNQWMALASEKGIQISINGGLDWSLAPGTPTDQPAMEVEFSSAGLLYGTVGYEASSTPAASVASTVWKANTTDLPSATFSNITPLSGVVTNTAYGRIELAIAPYNSQLIYAAVAGKAPASGSVFQSTLAGLFVSYNGGSSWAVAHVGSAQLDPMSNGGTRSSGDYAVAMTVDPGNPNILYFGSYRNYMYQRTGGTDANPIGTMYNISITVPAPPQFFVNQNIHDIKLIGSGNSTKYYYVTDAGIFRSIDLYSSLFVNPNIPPSFQPFYKGLVTGQFNSVSIERFPLASGINGAPGSTITPYSGFIGGTGGNGLIYFSGQYPNVTQEEVYVGGDIFAAEYSKILSNAAYFTAANGTLYRTTDVKVSEPDAVDITQNTAGQTVAQFASTTYTASGTPFKLWENYGQSYKGSLLKTPDSLVFYNDTSFALSTINTLSATTNFTFSVGRPQSKAAIDYITVRTTTVKVATTPEKITVTGYSVVNTRTLGIQTDTYTLPQTGTLSVPIQNVSGYSTGSLSSYKVILNSNTNFDEIQIALAGPLFNSTPGSNPPVANVANYVRLKATVYYKYKQGDNVTIEDNSISTLGKTYTVQTQQDLKWTLPPSSPTTDTTNKVQKYPQQTSARLAYAYVHPKYPVGIYVSKAPLDLNAPLNGIMVSSHKAITTYSNGDAKPPTTSNTISVIGKPTLIEWSKSGTELYYATDAGRVYRVSNLVTILDSTSRSYGGKLQTGIFSAGGNTANPVPNPKSPYRTALLRNFGKKISSISVAQNDSVILVTFDDPTTKAMVNTGNIKKCDSTTANFTDITGTGLGNRTVYCSLLEMNDYKKAFIGTDEGIFYNSNIITSTTWTKANNGQLPNVQIFDIKQQTMGPWECYNSGQIYVATNGRGIWTNRAFLAPSVVSVEEIMQSGTESLLKLYPNPASNEVSVFFRAYDAEKASLNIMDINGRLVRTQSLGTLMNGEVNFAVDTETLSSGVYIVNISSNTGVRRVSKLIITR